MSKFAILFPGQGLNYVEIGKELYTNHEIVKRIYKIASEKLDINIKDLCFSEKKENLNSTHISQLMTFINEYSMYKVYEEKYKFKPDYLAGHSLGEYVALSVSGALTFEEGISLIDFRGRVMEKACSNNCGSMIAVGDISRKDIQNICDEINKDKLRIMVSNNNSKNQIVLSGYSKDIDDCMGLLEDKGGIVKKLKVAGAFHSDLMIKAAEELKIELKNYQFKNLEIPVISNLTGKKYEKESDFSEILYKHMIKPVLWSETIDYLREKNVTMFLEMNTKNTLGNLVKTNYSLAEIYSFCNNEEEFGNVINCKKLEVVKKAISIAICTKNNTELNNDEYREKFIEPYRKLFTYFKEIEAEPNKIGVEEIKEILVSLNSMLGAKNISQDEEDYRIDELEKSTFISKFIPNYELCLK